MPRQKSLLTVIRDMVQQEVRSEIQSLLGWSSAEGRCREDGAEEGNGCDFGFEGEDRSPSSQASAQSRSSAWVEEEGGLMARAEEPLTQLATRIPKDLHRRLKLHCVTNDIMVQDFVVEAIEEKLGRKPRPKKGTA